MKKKKKTSSQKEKALQKTERESFRFQMIWEAKKLYPGRIDELPARVEAECAIIEGANLLPDLQAGADFFQKFRIQFWRLRPYYIFSFFEKQYCGTMHRSHTHLHGEGIHAASSHSRYVVGTSANQHPVGIVCLARCL